MLVRFKRKAFIGGKFYKPSDYGQEVSDEYRDALPKDADILDEDEVARAKALGGVPRSGPRRQVALSELAKESQKKPAVTGVPGDQRTSGGLDEKLDPQSDNTHGMSKEDPAKPSVDPTTLSEMNKLLSKDMPDDDDDDETPQAKANKSTDARAESLKGADEKPKAGAPTKK